MKKFFALLMSLAMVLSLAACGGGEATEEGGSGGDGGNGETKVLRLSTHLSIDHSTMQMAQKFKELLVEKSGGSLDVEFYTDGQLGGQTENCESLKAGTLDMTIIDTGTLANYNPAAGILDMPYLFSTKEQAIETVSGDIGKDFMDMVTETTGIRPISLQTIAFRSTLLKDTVIETLDDFKGVKVRIPENPSIEACFSALGATPVAIPSGEAYTAVQTGVTNGLEGNMEYIAQMKFYEVANVFNLTEHVMTFTAFCMSDAVYQSLTAEQQTAIDEAAAEAMDYFYDLYEDIEADAKQAMVDAGVSFVEIDKAPLIEACAPALEEFVAENGLEDMYSAIQALA
jgi:tripartite ATP-independent transporter DctP family solute receptor|nr:TRAP transporter substrate-binding protein [uncultured Oscillibacter sp.]